MANIAILEKTPNTIYAYLENLDPAYSRNDRYIDWYTDADYQGTTYLPAYASSGGDIVLSGLSAFTEYIITADVYYYGGHVVLYDDSEFTRPNYFDWGYAKTSGGSFNLTASEWNALRTNINQVRWYRDYSTASMTIVSQGDDLTASIYNEAVDAIQGIAGYGTYLPTATQGDPVTAYHFNILVSELNAIP